MKIRSPKMLHLANSDDLLLLNVNNVDIDWDDGTVQYMHAITYRIYLIIKLSQICFVKFGVWLHLICAGIMSQN